MKITHLIVKFFSLDSFALEDNGKFKNFPTGSVTHGSEMTFLEFLELFKSFRLSLSF